MTISKDEEIKIRGCSPVEEIIIPDENLEDLVYYLSHLPMANKKYSISRMSLENILHDGQYFIDSLFKLHDIPHIKIKKIPIIKKNLTLIRDIHPYKLPIKYVEGSGLNGQVEEFFYPNSSTIYFQSLGLGEVLSELSSASYVHEITHTQLDSQKGSYQNYYNQEVLSIFLEFFHASLLSTDENALRLQEANRIYELNELTKQQLEGASGHLNLSRAEQIENSKYISSDLIAMHLFHIFYYASTSIKKEMLKDIQEIFNGNITVEDYLSKYEVSFSNSQDKNTLRKYLYRIGK